MPTHPYNGSADPSIGLDKRDQKPAPTVGGGPPQLYREQPPGRDIAVWEDPCNFDHQIASQVPMDGQDLSVYKLLTSKGIQTFPK
mgnify:CR=1 FL=1